MKRTLLIVALLPYPALGATPCLRVEYADARDWPAERLELGYCLAQARADSKGQLLQELRAKGLLSGRDSAEITSDQVSCLEQAEMFGRVLENAKSLARPKCDAKGKPVPR